MGRMGNEYVADSFPHEWKSSSDLFAQGIPMFIKGISMFTQSRQVTRGKRQIER